MNDPGAVITAILEAVPNATTEAYHLTTYRLYRDSPTKGIQEVRIEIWERPDAPSMRYSVMATAEDGTSAAGNPSDDLTVALYGVHWRDLDKEPTRATAS